MAQPKNSTPIVSEGAPVDVAGADDDDPACRQSTVPVSSHAAMNGSQWPVCNDGSPSRSGSSGKDTAVNPFAALARISAAPSSGLSSQGSWSGMIRPG
jgi:hypothetical protein